MTRLAAAALGLSAILAAGASPAAAQLQGETFIHDPSTVTESDGKYYTFGTRGGGLVSDDGWTCAAAPSVPAAASRPT